MICDEINLLEFYGDNDSYDDIKYKKFMIVPLEILPVLSAKYNLSPQEILIFYLMNNRVMLSLKNKDTNKQWIDKETGRIFFKFSQSKMAEELNISRSSVTRTIKLLNKLKLIFIIGKADRANKYIVRKIEYV